MNAVWADRELRALLHRSHQYRFDLRPGWGSERARIVGYGSACLLSRLCGLSRLLLAGLLLLLLRLFRFVPSVFNGIERILTLGGSGRGRHE
jgi:hypothetical protein